MEHATSPALSAEAVDLAVRLVRTPDGRLEGTLHRTDQAEEIAFSGTLDLLKALETALTA
ncbi:hypothetical protein [Nocardioides sp. MH1]|uniref:hypothetical protein n=1 Tax=Nocardioides sp. MH1 TaxID=3242490 RepID=UPI003522A1C9